MEIIDILIRIFLSEEPAMPTSRSMRQLGRQRLDERLEALRSLPASARAAPRRGWIRAIRDALGMPRHALGKRMGVGEKRVQQMELAEVRGGITTQALARAAAALDCELVIALVPRIPLKARVQERRLRLANDWLRTRMLHTMSLEGQDIRYADLPPAAVQEIERLFPDERLWDAP
jgi:predicted DNA-binding mobile mystery protein A